MLRSDKVALALMILKKNSELEQRVCGRAESESSDSVGVIGYEQKADRYRARSFADCRRAQEKSFFELTDLQSRD